MMDSGLISRREWIVGGVHLVVLTSAAMGWVGCSKKKLVCSDTSDLNTAAKQLRKALEYQDLSPKGDEKNCDNCQFFIAANDDECGNCTLVQGPISPSGYCNSWAPKES
ncbi:MAG: high-potential iron-sulfur protein [Polyangiales bacterium]